MNEFLGIDPSIPIFHLVPFIVFSPIFFLVLYHLGLKEIINPSPEVREQKRLLKEEKAREAAERQDKMKASGLKMKAPKKSPLQLLGQAIFFALFALLVVYFSTSPAYIAHPPEQGRIMLSFTHAGQHREECKKRSREELAKLAANMRAPMKCSRERWPLVIDLALDGENVYRGVAIPAGLSRDGHSSFYQKFPTDAGAHRIKVGMWDSGEGAGQGEHDYVLERSIELSPREILVIGFDNASGRFTLE
jgi:hypothetical protein